MSNLPDDFNPWLFDATIGSVMNDYQEMMECCLPELQKGVREMATDFPPAISLNAEMNIRAIVMTFIFQQTRHGIVVPDRVLQEFLLDVAEGLGQCDTLDRLCLFLDDAVYRFVHAVAKANYPHD